MVQGLLMLNLSSSMILIRAIQSQANWQNKE